MILYNFRIIFANKFIWFFVASVGIFILLSIIYVFNENNAKMHDMYGRLLFSGILIIFYPTVFGIQNDQDSRTIEILFGIPNYRYKVWLVRVSLIFLLTFLIMSLFASIASAAIVKFNVLEMAGQVMVPILLLGTMAFLLSALVRNGNGTAVIMIIFGLLFMTLADPLEKSRWNIFLNPFETPSGLSDLAWKAVTTDNRIIIGVAIVVFLLGALYLLQKREKFM
jgi:hypothetical protein